MRPEKQAIAREIKEQLASSKFAFLTDFTRMDTAKTTALRKKLRETGARFQVVPNRLFRVVAQELNYTGIETALKLYRLDNGFYPTQDQGLDALVTRPNLPPEPQNYRTGGYLKKVPKDPWGREFIYRMPGDHGEYDLLSYGPDGQEGGEEKNKDITNWE